MRKLAAKINTGFTLVEVAVVMVIIGLIVTFAASILRNVGGLTKLRDARDRLNSAADSTISRSAKYNRIPFNLYSASVTKDAWNRDYRYFRNYSATNNNLQNFCGTKSTPLHVLKCNDSYPTCTSRDIIQDVAFLIVSPGQNGGVETLRGACPSTLNTPQAKCIQVYEPSSTYDDVYRFITLAELQKTTGCISSDAQLRIINLDLPTGKIGSNYKVAVIADGGVPSTSGSKYSWCYDESTLPSPTVTFSPAINACSSSFSSASFVNISGIPPSATAYSFKLKVKDSVNNIASKTFVLTANP